MPISVWNQKTGESENKKVELGVNQSQLWVAPSFFGRGRTLSKHVPRRWLIRASRWRNQCSTLSNRSETKYLYITYPEAMIGLAGLAGTKPRTSTVSASDSCDSRLRCNSVQILTLIVTESTVSRKYNSTILLIRKASRSELCERKSPFRHNCISLSDNSIMNSVSSASTRSTGTKSPQTYKQRSISKLENLYLQSLAGRLSTVDLRSWSGPHI